jgi:predicted RecA/RadA family phage recombinase
MRKIAPAAFLLAGILVFGGLFVSTPAHADDDEDETSSSEVSPAPLQTQNPKVHSPKGPNPLREPKEHIKRRELEQKYGKEGRLSLPPLVIRPKRDTDDVAEGSAFELEDEDDEGSATGSPSSNGEVVTGTANKATAGSATAGSAANGTSGQSSSGSNQTVGKASAGFIAVNPAAKGSVVAVKSGTMVNPQQNTAIDLSTVNFTKKTPADVFIQAAQVGLYAMAAGALVLSAVAASRAIRRK